MRVDQRECQLLRRRELLVATAALQRARLGQDLRHAPWVRALGWARSALRVWRVVKGMLWPMLRRQTAPLPLHCTST